MNIEVLREFTDLAYTLNFKKTADRMYITPSTLSKHIMSLEKELGDVVLFHRSKHTVELTELGKAFLPKIQKTLSDYDSALAVIQQSRSSICGKITIGFLDAAAKNILPSVLEKYRDLYPEVQVNLFSGQVGDLLEAYNNQKMDIALTMLFPNAVPPSSANVRTLCEDSVSVVFPSGHPLEKKEHIYIDDLLQYPLILPSHQQFHDYALLVEDYIEHGPMPPNVICDFTHIDTAIIMIEANMGISILPTNISRNTSTVVFREISDYKPVLKIIIVWNKRRINPGTLEFVELISREYSG